MIPNCKKHRKLQNERLWAEITKVIFALSFLNAFFSLVNSELFTKSFYPLQKSRSLSINPILRKFTSTYYRKTKGFFFLALTCLLSLHSNPSLPVVCPLTDMQKTTWRARYFSQYMLAMQFWPWNFSAPHIPICNTALTVLPCWELYFGLALSGSYVRVQDLTLKKVSYVMSYLLLFFSLQ